LKLARRKLALLLRLAFLEGVNRAEKIFLQRPPARVWVFSERITFYMKGARHAGGGTTAYAWFVWDKAALAGTELRWLKPGYKARYGRPRGPAGISATRARSRIISQRFSRSADRE
jgi:hypothetical protein